LKLLQRSNSPTYQTVEVKKLQKCGKRREFDFSFLLRYYLFWEGFDLLGGAFRRLVSTDFLGSSMASPNNLFDSAENGVIETSSLLG
jgi:hypothetical protein